MTVERLLLNTLKGQHSERRPIWLMRQAGRYLPEYRALRSAKDGFLGLVYDSSAAAEVTLQPIKRFGFDGAILFSDILVIPYALGQNLWFEDGEGPRLSPRLIDGHLGALKCVPERLEPIYDTVRKVREGLLPSTTLLGFAGSPWTVATYMLHGRGSKDQSEARRFAYSNADAFEALIDAITELTVTYLHGQIMAGVDAIQLFESWSGTLSPAQFERWVIIPNARIVSALRAIAPEIPIIGFPKGAGGKLLRYVIGVNPSAIALDETVDPHWAHSVLPPEIPVQGNLDPLALITGGNVMKSAVDDILAAFSKRPHIFNLGHGILPDTPIAHVEQLLHMVRGQNQ